MIDQRRHPKPRPGENFRGWELRLGKTGIPLTAGFRGEESTWNTVFSCPSHRNEREGPTGPRPSSLVSMLNPALPLRGRAFLKHRISDIQSAGVPWVIRSEMLTGGNPGAEKNEENNEKGKVRRVHCGVSVAAPAAAKGGLHPWPRACCWPRAHPASEPR